MLLEAIQEKQTLSTHAFLHKRDYPLLIKYMGSKSKIMDFVVEGISQVYNGGRVCDLFAGSSSLSGAIGDQTSLIINDIQSYSCVLATTYIDRLSDSAASLDIYELVEKAKIRVDEVTGSLPDKCFFSPNPSLDDFVAIEKANRSLIDEDFGHEYHLFLKYYAGTWWSAEQCAWIDALREQINLLRKKRIFTETDFCVALTCVMHAMAYCGQGTGHFAQYRDAKNESSKNDINSYRKKDFAKYFVRKWDTLKDWNLSQNFIGGHVKLNEDYSKCLSRLSHDTVYADPPYAFVHYSRFYHAFETFIKYDFPALQFKAGQLVKGRYRENRHQSPFSIRTQVPDAFSRLFEGVRRTNSNLVLSYSNTGLYCLDDIQNLAESILGTSYELDVLTMQHTHMTMGRREDRTREVQEALLLAKLK